MSPRKAAALRDSDGERGLRDHLVITAQRLIAEQGAAGLTVRAIARAAGVADGVLYNHFADKEELLAEAVRAHVAAAHRDMGPLPAPGTATLEANLSAYLRAGLALHRSVVPVFAGLIATPAVLARIGEPGEGESHWRDDLANYLRAERDRGRLAADADIAAAVAVLVGVCHDEVLSAVLPGIPRAPAAIESVVTTLLDGIGPR
ncbi:helix-turn-helix domain-containing protein [Nocardia sp. NPDC051030]|uniref:TetR/AcrR family transcriptional regulator n=1 Tax=Nocardia sp. NPDC051030 TaxID=3155162 RepID=UPI003435B99E